VRRLVAALALAALALVAVPAASAFVPNDPLASRQWYLTQVHAFDLWPDAPPTNLVPVKVAVIDTGIDVAHPEFQNGKIAAVRSFVGGDVNDTDGHGTFVAGLIAAGTNNGIGIAGLAFPAQLVVAKVVRPDGTIPMRAEARAIRWAVDQGARVVNLSFGGLRDPRSPERDTYSAQEQSAVDYAYRHGAVVVAAVGNSDEAPSTPWSFASYPAALPHVIGVSALAQDGSVPYFSNRDAVYDDIAAPGEGMISTLPLAMTAQDPSCPDQGYSDCGPAEFRNAEGTSFAAPLVSAAAALVLAMRPELTPDQVAWVLERSAVDVSAATGCRTCELRRDALSGWGRLDVAAALTALGGPLPQRDRFETNDEAGVDAYPLYGRRRVVKATLDFWDDQLDVYRVRLVKGQRLRVSLAGPRDTDSNLVLWKPGTTHVEGFAPDLQGRRATQSARAGARESFAYRARATGWYYVEVKLATPGAGAYTLHVVKAG